MRKRPFPPTVDLAITGRCNLRCKHCNTADTWDLENEFSFEDIIGVLDELKKEKVFNLNLFGGEPFAYPRINDLLKELNNFPMRVTVLTNGTLIDETTIKHLKEMKFLSVVQVSVDGSSAEIHDWQRGEGAFEKTKEAVKLLLKNGLPVNMKAIINKHNYRDIEGMVKMASSLGLTGMDFGDAVECGRAAVYSSDMRVGGEIHNYIMKEMFRIKRKYTSFDLGGTLAQKMEMIVDFYVNGPGNGKRGNFSICSAGENMISIRSDGKVVPCSAFWTLVCGDTKKQSLREIWDTSKVLNEIREIAAEPLTKYNPACQKCDYMTYCNGGCRAAAYYSSGDDLRGFDLANCMVFSDRYNFRLDKDEVLLKQEQA